MAAADQRALEKLVGKLVQDTKALRRRPALGGFREINAIIVQDPDNPDQVSICFDIAISRDDGGLSGVVRLHRRRRHHDPLGPVPRVLV